MGLHILLGSEVRRGPECRVMPLHYWPPYLLSLRLGLYPREPHMRHLGSQWLPQKETPPSEVWEWLPCLCNHIPSAQTGYSISLWASAWNGGQKASGTPGAGNLFRAPSQLWTLGAVCPLGFGGAWKIL